MAKAPVPGRAEARAAAEEAANVRLRMTMGERTLELAPASLSLDERFVIRNATGLPFEAFFAEGQNTIGEDSVAVLWWLARRANGEPHLAWRQFQSEWVFDAETFDLNEVTEDDPEDQSPEG